MLQPSYVVQDKFTRRKKNVPAIKYKADFFYREDGLSIVEDTKGVLTDVFQIKRKLFHKAFPDYILRISKQSGSTFSIKDY